MFAEPDADPLGNGHPRASKDADRSDPDRPRFQRASAQVVSLLVAPVASSTVKPGKRGQEAGTARPASENTRLLFA